MHRIYHIGSQYDYLARLALKIKNLELGLEKAETSKVDETRLDMKRIVEESEYEDIMNITWLCHNPINDKPCGYCNPCVSTIEEGMEYRFSKEALERYNKRKYYRFIRKIKNGVKKFSDK